MLVALGSPAQLWSQMGIGAAGTTSTAVHVGVVRVPMVVPDSCVSLRVVAAQERGARVAVMSIGSLGGFHAKLGGGGGGAGVLERPGLDQSSPDTTPKTEEGGEMGKSTQKVRLRGGDRCRVLLLDDERHTEAHVAKALPKAVPAVSYDQARECFFQSRQLGKAVVIVAVQEHAEMYADYMLRHGLRSAIEPDGTTI